MTHKMTQISILRQAFFVSLMSLISWVYVYAQSPSVAQSPNDAQTHHQWSYNLGMYEVNLRHYSQEGNFAGFAKDLDRIDSLGPGIIWFMPVHPIGEFNRLGSLGSPYSVKDYYTVNPDYGSLEEFKDLVSEIKRRDKYVIIDWVANHTAWDNVLTETNPEWYVTNSNGDFIPPPGTNWSDVIELDFDQQGLRDYMIKAMLFWVDSVGVDGFRFDAVDFVPDDFWEEAIPALKQTRPDLFFLAEGPGEHLMDLGFDMNYSWDFYGFGGGILPRITQGIADANSFRSFVNQEQNNYSNGAYRLYFVSNHDENAWEGTPAQLFGPRAVNFSVLSHVINGMPLVYNGEEAGMNKQLAFFDKDLIPWRDYPIFDYYRRLFDLKRRNAALWNGFDENEAQRIKTTQNSPIYAFKREKDGDRIVGLFNLTNQAVSFQATDELPEGTYRNVFTDELIGLSQDYEFSLGDWEFLVLELVNQSSSESIGELEWIHNFQTHGNLQLNPAYPNPFNPSTNVSFVIETADDIRIQVWDIMGRLITEQQVGNRDSGYHSFPLEAYDWPSGVYILRVWAGYEFQQNRITLMK